MSRVKSPTHLIDFWSLKSILKSLEIILISMKSNDFEITYAIFASVGPLELASYILISQRVTLHALYSYTRDFIIKHGFMDFPCLYMH